MKVKRAERGTVERVTTEVDPKQWHGLKVECAKRDIKIHEAMGMMIGWFLAYEPEEGAK